MLISSLVTLTPPERKDPHDLVFDIFGYGDNGNISTQAAQVAANLAAQDAGRQDPRRLMGQSACLPGPFVQLDQSTNA